MHFSFVWQRKFLMWGALYVANKCRMFFCPFRPGVRFGNLSFVSQEANIQIYGPLALAFWISYSCLNDFLWRQTSKWKWMHKQVPPFSWAENPWHRVKMIVDPWTYIFRAKHDSLIHAWFTFDKFMRASERLSVCDDIKTILNIFVALPFMHLFDWHTACKPTFIVNVFLWWKVQYLS